MTPKKDASGFPHEEIYLGNAAGGLRTDLNTGFWKLGSVPVDQIESIKSNWCTAKLEPGIIVGETSINGDSYEVAFRTSYLPWLSFHELRLNLDYNPTTPTEKDQLIQGKWETTRRTHAHFLRNAVKAIYSEHASGYEACYRGIACSNGLEIPLQREILKHDILKSDPQVRKRFTRYLVFLDLRFLQDYESCDAVKLLAKNEDDLRSFGEAYTTLFQAASKEGGSTRPSDSSELHMISLARAILELAKGRVDCRQYALDQYTYRDNLNMCARLIDVEGITDIYSIKGFDQYWAARLKKRFNHESAFEQLGPLLHKIVEADSIDVNEWIII